MSVVARRRRVAFLHSHPYRIPLGAVVVESIAPSRSAPRFDRLHGGFPESGISADGHAAGRGPAARWPGVLDGSWPRG